MIADLTLLNGNFTPNSTTRCIVVVCLVFSFSSLVCNAGCGGDFDMNTGKLLHQWACGCLDSILYGDKLRIEKFFLNFRILKHLFL